MQDNALIRAEHFSVCLPAFTHRRRIALCQPVSFCLNKGDFLWIRGPNGVGKSTLLKQLARVHDKKRPPHGLTFHLALNKIAFTPQQALKTFSLPITLKEILENHLVVHGGMPLEKLLERYPLLNATSLSRLWNTASGGERQRTLLLLSLSQSPEVLLLDEPLNHMDKEATEYFYDFFKQWTAAGKTLVLVSHTLENPPEGAKLLDLKAVNEGIGL